ncbi:MAG: M1 family metallopeptidase, partial [Anaerolineae bacterium]|nr:M1 family metallopeptidase [Anaerolineae bacterium]
MKKATLVPTFILLLLLASCIEPEQATEDSLAPYKQSLLPAFQGDIASLGEIPRYRIAVSLDADALTLTGRQQVFYTNNESNKLGEVYFRLYPNLPQFGGQMQVQRATVGARDTLFTYEAGNTALKLPLTPSLLSGEGVQIELDFTVQVPRASDEKPHLFGLSQGILSLPNFYPMLAVHEAAGWHLDMAPEFSDAVFSEVALYEVSIIAPLDMVIVTSGSALETQPNPDDGTQTVYCTGGPMRDFSLIMSRELQIASTTAYSTTVNSYYLPPDASSGQAVLQHAAAALRAYSDAFGPYPFAEFDVVEAPLGNRGMEYPGLILVGTDLYSKRADAREFMVVHEVGHQWWYSLVGNNPVNHPWLDEGLTEYSVYVYNQMIHSGAAADELVESRWLIPYQVAVGKGLDAAADQSSLAFSEENYEYIVYAKGALFFHALHQAVGDQVYLAIMQEYLQQYKHGIATPADFLRVAEAVSGQDLSPIYQEWV